MCNVVGLSKRWKSCKDRRKWRKDEVTKESVDKRVLLDPIDNRTDKHVGTVWFSRLFSQAISLSFFLEVSKTLKQTQFFFF